MGVDVHRLKVTIVLVGVTVIVGPGVGVIVGLAKSGMNSASALHPEMLKASIRMKVIVNPTFCFA